MITPTLNINGSSADDLIEPRIAAYDALRDVIKTLAQVTPHGRDYLGDNDRFAADYVAHYDRLNALHKIAAEIVAEAVNIQEQVK
jgi:hypothetical protein